MSNLRASTTTIRDTTLTTNINISLDMADYLNHPVQLRALLSDAALRAAVISPHRRPTTSLRPAEAMAGALAPWQLMQIRLAMLEHFGKNVPVVELARMCRLSPGYFSRAFRRSMGESPHKWTVQLRIGIVQDLAYRTSLSVQELATLCDFVDQSHLNRWFTYFNGIGIAKWRRSAGRY
jgi:transcriptional regulator GlxA family with amidase domain